jgi:uncharacterized Zn finger protein (UPF0148 family)
MIGLWLQSGKDLNELFRMDRVLAAELHTFRVQLVPDRNGAPRLSILTAPQGDGQQTIHNLSLSLFIDFLLNPERDLLGGPCKECGLYFVKKTRRRNTYCSARCGTRHTSRESNQRSYSKERNAKLLLIEKRIDAWLKTDRRLDWKSFVCRKGDISKKFLTQLMESGELSAQVDQATFDAATMALTRFRQHCNVDVAI